MADVVDAMDDAEKEAEELANKMDQEFKDILENLRT